MTTLEDCRARDAHDLLRDLRNQFALPDGVIYLDGNSLGALPKIAAARVQAAITQQWGDGLIRSWNSAGWVDLPQRLGDKIARLIGAAPGEVVATDSTSVNLFKVLSVAIAIAKLASTRRNIVISEASNFPTDLYIAEGLCKERGLELKLMGADDIAAAIDERVAVVMLTHVNYRTGAMHDMAAMTAAAHASGALMVWDLAHSAGAVPVDLHAAGADFAVGCGYKYFNGGPGAPAFVWMHPRHAEGMSAEVWQPLSGWWGHTSPFAFMPDYRPASGIARYLCGTQPILSMVALESGLDTVLAAEAFGGMAALRKKSLALTDLFIELVEQHCDGHGLKLITPRDHGLRGSQVCLSRVDGAHAIVQALIARGVIGDFRAGDEKNDSAPAKHQDILRFGFTPLYTSFEEVWQAVEQLRQVLESGEWRNPEFNRKQAVT
jgi:kynureninase